MSHNSSIRHPDDSLNNSIIFQNRPEGLSNAQEANYNSTSQEGDHRCLPDQPEMRRDFAQTAQNMN